MQSKSCNIRFISLACNVLSLSQLIKQTYIVTNKLSCSKVLQIVKLQCKSDRYHAQQFIENQSGAIYGVISEDRLSKCDAT